MHKTLPAAFRGRGGGPNPNREGHEHLQRIGKRTSTSAANNPTESSSIFGGLNLNLGISNLISGGMNLLGHFRKKTPNSSTVSTPVHPSSAVRNTSGFPAEQTSWSDESSNRSSRSSSVSSSDVYYEAYEHIELHSFPTLPEAAGEDQTGEGHSFSEVGSFNPIWCDLCGNLIWGLYDTGASKCVHCDYTCHVKCQRRIRLNCSSLNNEKGLLEKEDASNIDHGDDNTLADVSELQSEEASAVLSNDDQEKTLKGVDLIELDNSFEDGALDNDLPLESDAILGQNFRAIISTYNAVSPPGLDTTYDDECKMCHGFIRVQLNLRRPINVISGTNPPSIYNITNEDTANDKTLTSFYLPADTEKALHVTSATTTKDVIRSLLSKFRVADTPHKYALYDKTLRTAVKDDENGTSTLSRIRMRKMRDEERPLVLSLSWCRDDILEEKCLVLQENDPGEVSWESFSMPELKNFLLILDREEAWYKKRIHDKYEFVRSYMQDLVNEKKRASPPNEDDLESKI